MEKPKPQTFYFNDDGSTPNNVLPVIIYKDILRTTNGNLSDFLEQIFQENDWTNNWRDIILSEDHYHSTTHEVLGISHGSVSLQLGGENGKQLQVSAGDILILPAGVAHRSLDKHTDYEVVGGYPNGRSWDMIYCEPDKYHEAQKRISALPIPKTDPVYGEIGPLTELWN